MFNGILGAINAPTHTATKVGEEAESLVNAATGLFDGVVPIILAVVGLGVLLVFVKRVKKG